MDLAKRFNDNLAAYSIPVFLRICKRMDRTGTFKLKKSDLQKEGFDLVSCGGDSLYIWNNGSKAYFPLDYRLQTEIESGSYTRF